MPVEDMRDLSDMPAAGRAAGDGDAGPGAAPVDLAARRGAGARPDPGAPVHDRVRQLAAAGRAAVRAAQRAGGRAGLRRGGRHAGGPGERATAEAVVIARAHHGSVSRQERTEIEEALKAGRLPAVVATSSLELGIDMGAVDLVIQVESPPSVASGLQRVGRAGHNVGDVSRGVIFPKYAADLVQAAVVADRMQAGADRGAAHTAQPARRARPAGRRDGRARRLGGGRPGGRGPAVGAVRDADQVRARGGARHARRALPGRGVRRAQAADRVGPGRRGHPRPAGRAEAGGDQRRDDPRPRATSACSCPPGRRTPGRRGGSASSTRRWCTSRGSATCSCSAPRRGGSRTSRPTGCSCCPRPASRASCRSGTATRPGRPAELGKAIGAKVRELAALPDRRRPSRR